MIRNNALLHEKLGLTIQFPAGWRVQNRPDRVVATSPDGDALVELAQGPKNDNPLETLQQGVKLDAGARYDSGHLSGYPAAFAAGAQQGKPVVVAAVVFNGTQYLIAGMTKDTLTYERERGALRAAINSFRAITPAEKLAARPYVLQLITARPGLTMAALARRSPLAADAERQLRLMNDFYPSWRAQAGPAPQNCSISVRFPLPGSGSCCSARPGCCPGWSDMRPGKAATASTLCSCGCC